MKLYTCSLYLCSEVFQTDIAFSFSFRFILTYHLSKGGTIPSYCPLFCFIFSHSTHYHDSVVSCFYALRLGIKFYTTSSKNSTSICECRKCSSISHLFRTCPDLARSIRHCYSDNKAFVVWVLWQCTTYRSAGTKQHSRINLSIIKNTWL